MVLHTMNDEEKAYEAFRITDYLCNCMDNVTSKVIGKFKKGTKFPYVQRIIVKDDKYNEWNCVFIVLSKEAKKKGLMFTSAYTVYEVPRKYKEEDLNAGKGCIMFDPYDMRARLRKEFGRTTAVIYDIVPHAFNRYTERYLKPLGKENIEFGYKVESMLKRWLWFDISADIYGDKNAKKHSNDDCICPYDVFMRKGGMLRGQIINELLIRINTYITEDMMFDNQLERQKEMQSEYFRFKTKKLLCIQ